MSHRNAAKDEIARAGWAEVEVARLIEEEIIGHPDRWGGEGERRDREIPRGMKGMGEERGARSEERGAGGQLNSGVSGERRGGVREEPGRSGE